MKSHRTESAGRVRGSTLLLFGRGISVGLNFLTQVLTVRYLAKADYGALAYALALASTFAQLSQFGMDKAVSRVAAVQDELRHQWRMVGTLVFAGALVLVCGGSLAVGFWTVGDDWGPSFVSDPLSLNLLLILIALAPIDALDRLTLAVYAVFSRPSFIFFRKHVVGPSLKLLAIAGVMLASEDVVTLAIWRVVASLLGLAIGASLLGRVFREHGILSGFSWRKLDVRVREILGYSLPMLGSDAVLLLRGTLVVLMLEFVHGTLAVADFRSVLPVARLNRVALDSFVLLFVPAVARLSARRDSGDLNDTYWQSVSWVTVLSLPVFLVTVCFARPLTVLLFGPDYAAAAPVLALLSAGAFVNATLDMSGYALKGAGHVGNVLRADAVALAMELSLLVLLIPRFGAIGGAAVAAGTAVVHGVLYQVILTRTMGVAFLPVGYRGLYGAIGGVALAIYLIDLVFAPTLWVGVPLAAAAWLVLLVYSAPKLHIDTTFPELMRLPILGPLLAAAARRSRGPRGRSVDAAPRLAAALEDAVPEAVPELGGPPTRVDLLREHHRAGSKLFEFDVSGPRGRLPVLVKVSRRIGDAEMEALLAQEDFPRLGARVHPRDIIDGERRTLLALQDHFSELADRRFDAVRVFDAPPDPGTLAMERFHGRTLRHLVGRQALSPWSEPPPSLLTPCSHAGAWLRTLHDMPRFESTRSRLTTRADFLAFADQFTSFLRREVDARHLARVTHCLTVGAQAALPEKPPCGNAHGDFAARNVIVGPDERVAVIDIPGRWWSAVYLDLGYFIADLHTLLPLALTGGLLPTSEALRAMEEAFLRGYFSEEDIPRDQIRLYEILALLARWCSATHASRHDGAPAFKRPIMRLRTRIIRQKVDRALIELEGSAAALRGA